MEKESVKNYLAIISVLFIEGFVSLSFQMLYIRQLTPFVGNSVEVVSWIIGVFLIALAIGYKKGGSHPDTEIVPILIKNLYLSFFIAGIGLSFMFLEIYFGSNILSSYSLMIIYCFLIIFPTTYFLGQTLPLITNIMKGKNVAEISGNILFLSTIGSFLGAIITTNILLRYFGVSITIFINLCLIVALIIFLDLYKKQKDLLFKSFLLSISLIFMYAINIPIENGNFVRTNQYANYKIINAGKLKIFSSNKSYSSILDNENKYGYIKFLEKLIFEDLKIKDKDILVIGAGGFLFSKNMEYTKNRFTYVDIDPEIKDIAEKTFLNESINGRFIPLDGRNFINENKNKFDVIFLDAYSSKLSMPSHLLTEEFFLKVKEDVKEDGIIVINTIFKTDFKDEFSMKLNKTITNIFENCYVHVITPNLIASNVEYICFNHNPVKSYSDDKNNSNSDFYNLSKE